MKKIYKRSISLLTMFLLVISLCQVNVFAVEKDNFNVVLKDVSKYIYETVSCPQVGSVGGEWTIIGLARSNYNVPNEYYQEYYRTVEKYVKACKGVLHNKKYTEYSRVVLALTAIGQDPTNVAGYNLLTPLGDYEKTIWQGLNGPIWALIALDSGNYKMPKNDDADIQATREMYVNRILDCQLSDGGWSLFGGTKAESDVNSYSDPDITGMALQALSKYQDNDDVKKAIKKALKCMSKQQNDEAGFKSWGNENAESCIQMIVALGELGIGLDDERLIKNNKTMLDNLLTFYNKNTGFIHTKEGSGCSLMSSEQGLYGLVSVYRAKNNKSSLYRMNDALDIGDITESNINGLPGKNKNINVPQVSLIGKTFPDITGVDVHKNLVAIEQLASRAIIDGKTNGNFEPDKTMTRAQFATIIVKALGLKGKYNGEFKDVKEKDWYSKYVGIASAYGIITGKPNGNFDPTNNISREQVAVMVARAAKLCGMKTDYTTMYIRDILSQFVDYVKCQSYSRSSLAFCYNEEILDSSVININPSENVTRAEIAQMIFNMLSKAKLI